LGFQRWYPSKAWYLGHLAQPAFDCQLCHSLRGHRFVCDWDTT